MGLLEASFDRKTKMIGSKFKTKPYSHQLECLNKFGREEYFALLAEMGTGKTWIMINNMADLWASGDCDAVIVFAPNGVHSNWIRSEIPKHMPDWVRYRCAAWSSNPKKKDAMLLDSLLEQSDGELKLLAMNWESLNTKKGGAFIDKIINSSMRLMIICDESDAIKNPSAARTKSLMKIKKHAAWRRIMTGTPINNSPFDAYSQFNFLHESILGTTSFYAFKSEYAELLQPGNPLLKSIQAKSGSRFTPAIVARDSEGVQKYRNLDKLHGLISPHSFRVLKSDCLDLPDKIYKTLFFELTPKQSVIYKKAKDECRIVFENEEEPINKLVSMGKLSQITSGYYLHPSSDKPVKIDGKNPKLILLIDRVKSIIDSGEKIIIWARFRVEISDIVNLLKDLKIKTVEYHGGISSEDRKESIDLFENGDAKVFVGNQQAGGTGITLIAASYMIYFSNSFSLRDRLQSEDRAHRIGQTRNVTYINLVGKNTIDEKIVDALINKKDVARQIIDCDYKDILK